MPAFRVATPDGYLPATTCLHHENGRADHRAPIVLHHYSLGCVTLWRGGFPNASRLRPCGMSSHLSCLPDWASWSSGNVAERRCRNRRARLHLNCLPIIRTSWSTPERERTGMPIASISCIAGGRANLRAGSRRGNPNNAQREVNNTSWVSAELSSPGSE